MKKLLTAAIKYSEKHGFSVIPTKRDKKALIKWEEYQKRKATSEEIADWWRKFPDANVGIVTGSVSDLAAVDIDGDEGKEAIQDFIPDSLITPTVETPKGRHLYFAYGDSNLCNNTRVIPGCDFRGQGGYVIAPPSIGEGGKQYRWVISLEDAPLSPLPEAYIDRIGQSNGINNCNSINNNSFSLYKGCRQNVDIFTQGRRDNDIFHLANCLVKGGMPQDEILQTLDFIASKCTPPFSLKDVETKLQSALKRSERRGFSLAQEVRAWVLSTNGYFSSTDVYNCLQLSTRDEKKNVHIILKRLSGEGLIERYGNKNGCFRVIDTTTEVIDFLNASMETLDIRFPLGEERFVLILPGNIIIIAGVSNAGKTAYLLNFIELNMHRFNIYYFNSEMGAIELRNRLSKFKRPLDSWKFKAIERSSNFADVIKPDDINLIDYLEIHDDFWKIGGMIKDIHDRLKKGIAIIALQKDVLKEYGVGGGRSVEKARLYLSMDPNKVRIAKAKNWAHESINPNGMELHFKLVKGCKFFIEQDWKRNE